MSLKGENNLIDLFVMIIQIIIKKTINFYVVFQNYTNDEYMVYYKSIQLNKKIFVINIKDINYLIIEPNSKKIKNITK